MALFGKQIFEEIFSQKEFFLTKKKLIWVFGERAFEKSFSGPKS